MDTRIKDYASTMMNNAVGKLKQAKADKAENAFYSLFDSAINGSGSAKSDSMNRLGNLSAGQDRKEVPDADMSGKDVQASDAQAPDAAAQPAGTQPDGKTVQEDAGQPSADGTGRKDVVGKVCEELGMTEEELFGQLEQFMDAIAQILTEKFGVSEEELTSVLDSLGMTLLDMLEQPNVMDVAMQLTGTEDIAAVLTDGDLYSQFQETVEELTQTEEQFFETSGLDAEELQVLHEELNVQKAEAVPEETFTVKEDAVAVKRAATEEAPQLELVTDRQDAGDMGGDDSSSQQMTGEREDFQQMTGQEAFQQFANRVSDYVNVTAGTDISYADQLEMQDIIRQVVDAVKIQVQADTTSLEMQLHPESYGKLNLHVSVREGAVTAQLAVENEMVKSALESQVLQLREAMNERGLRVDAVEVTIASHEFERNLEEGQGEHQQEEQAEGAQRRQINLQGEQLTLEELMEMSDAEALARRMMLENGNSIDYSA